MSEGDIVRVGVVGLNIGAIHIDAYQQADGCEVTAICDLDAERLRLIADQKGIPQTFTDVHSLFSSGEIDAVSICTPNALHAPLSIHALEAGLHVLVEKPMAMNTAEARGMVDVARRQNRKLAVHFNHRMVPHVQALRRMVDEGDFGELYFGRTTWHRRKGIPERQAFLSRRHAGGGAMIDLGVHQLDQLLFVMGHPRIESLSAQVYTKFADVDVPHLDMDVDDFSVAFLRFENGATAHMEISWAGHHHIHEHRVLQVYGTQAGARRELVEYAGGPNDLTIYHRHDGSLTADSIQDVPPSPTVQSDFIDAIRHDREPLCSAKHGLTTMMILDALYHSSATGKEVLFRELFVGECPTEASGTTWE